MLTLNNATRLYFGQNTILNFKSEIKQTGKHALILIGKGSVKQNGILDAVIGQIEKAGATWTLFEGIKSNPEYPMADLAVEKAREVGADMVVAVGGGSVIDTAKAVCLGVYYDGSVWDFYQRGAKFPTQALPLFAVLTLAATGTEMNMFSVLQDTAGASKRGAGNPLMFPRASFLDPAYTLSVNKTYTMAGVADLIAHTLEQYFDPTPSPLTDAFSTQLIRQAFIWGLKLNQNLQDLEARTEVMWLATIALNGTLAARKRGGDWGVHAFEHVLSVLYDVPHGAGLSIVYPAWLKHHRAKIEAKLADLEVATRGIPGIEGDDFISRLEHLFTQIETPIRLSQYKIGQDEFGKITQCLTDNYASGVFFEMKEPDYTAMLSLMA